MKKEYSKKCQRRKGIVNILIYLSLLPATTFAATDVASTLGQALSYLTGPVGKVVATLAIVGMGYACFAMGRVAKSSFISVIVGVSIIFGANALLTTLVGV